MRATQLPYKEGIVERLRDLGEWHINHISDPCFNETTRPYKEKKGRWKDRLEWHLKHDFFE